MKVRLLMRKLVHVGLTENVCLLSRTHFVLNGIHHFHSKINRLQFTLLCFLYASLDQKLHWLFFWALHETTVTIFQSCSTCDFIGFRVRKLPFPLKDLC